MNGYRIGELAQLSGYPKDTIRYYERSGLISAPPRSMSGYRLYPAATLERLFMVRRAKSLGFSLSEVGELLDMLEHRDTSCQHLHCRIIGKLEDLEGRITELTRLKVILQDLSQTCAPNTSIRHCPVLSVIAAPGTIAELLSRSDDD